MYYWGRTPIAFLRTNEPQYYPVEIVKSKLKMVEGMERWFTNDINGDGWLDIFVSNIAAEYALEESHFLFVSTGEIERMKDGIAPYVDLSEPLGL
ncbi:MAG: hypothetical protein ABFS56_24655 [Pseudomonadota bacterium]